jgi:SulP family sulfate permease
MITVLLLSTFWNLVNAVGVGLIIACLIFMKKIGDVTAKQSDVKPLKKEKNWKDEANFPEKLKNEVFIKHIKGPSFFGSTSNFQQLAKQIPESASTVIIRMGRMPYIDQSGLYVIEDILVDLKKEGKNVLFVGLLDQPKYMMERIDIIPDLIPREHMFSNFDSCLDWVKSNVVV